MLGERQTRRLLGPADPARRVAVPPVTTPASELIRRAEAAGPAYPAPLDHSARPAHPAPPVQVDQPARPSGRRPDRPRRRLVLAAAAATAMVGAAAVAYPLFSSTEEAPGGTELGAVVVPIGYQVTTDPPPAAEQLRALAAGITEAPYERVTGRYAHLYQKSWGDIRQESPDGHWMSYVQERELWLADREPGRERTATVGIEFPDEPSRRYFEGLPNADQLLAPDEQVSELPAGRSAPPPVDRDEVAEQLGATGASGIGKLLVAFYRMHPLPPWQTRAAVLEFLAEAGGFEWRGEVTDRLGRPGVAVSYQEPGQPVRAVLVFDSRTGELLAHELVDLSGTGPELRFYSVFRADRTEARPALTGPAGPAGPVSPAAPGASPTG